MYFEMHKPNGNIEVVEKRHEMILAHDEFGMSVKDIIKRYKVSRNAFYYWRRRYDREGLLGLFNRKRGTQIPHNKTQDKDETVIIQLASDYPEIDANDIHAIMIQKYNYRGTVRTIERILTKHDLNRPKGRRSKKSIEKKNQILKLLITED